VGDEGGQGGRAHALSPPKRFGKNIFSDNYRVKFGHFSGKYHVNFGNFVNFSVGDIITKF